MAIVSCVDEEIEIITTADVEFYKKYLEIQERILKENDILMSRKTKEILALPIEEIHTRYHYDDKIYEGGKEYYRYLQIKNAKEVASVFSEYAYSPYSSPEYLENLKAYGFTIKTIKNKFEEYIYALSFKCGKQRIISVSPKVIDTDYYPYFCLNEFIWLVQTSEERGLDFESEELVAHAYLSSNKIKGLSLLEYQFTTSECRYKDEVSLLARELRLPDLKLEKFLENTKKENYNKVQLAKLIQKEINYPIQEILIKLEDYHIYKKWEQKLNLSFEKKEKVKKVKKFF